MALTNKDSAQSSFAPHNGSHSQTEVPLGTGQLLLANGLAILTAGKGGLSSLSYGLWPPEVGPGYRPKLRPTYSRTQCQQHSCILSQNGPRWPQKLSFHGDTAWLKKIIFATTASKRSRKRRAPAAGLAWEKTKEIPGVSAGRDGPEWPLHRGPSAGPGQLRHHVFGAGPQMNANVVKEFIPGEIAIRTDSIPSSSVPCRRCPSAGPRRIPRTHLSSPTSSDSAVMPTTISARTSRRY